MTSVLVSLGLVGLLLLSSGTLDAGREQPRPAALGFPAPALEAAYHTAQADPSAGDEARVRSAVDTYFLLRYESYLRGQARDIGLVVDRSSRSGRSLYNYELGRMQYSLAAWRRGGLAFTAYSYRPAYDLIEVGRRGAKVAVHPWVDLTYADLPDRPETAGGETHTITLVRSAEGWKLTDDNYLDEFVLGFPRGTDFAALETSLEQDWAAAEARWQEFDREHANDSSLWERYHKGSDVGTFGYRTYDRSRCASYGNTYTDDSGGSSTANYNSLFISYPNDCQNFVSQCVWYGFGGQNNSTAIQNHYLPMVYNVSGATCWWADKGTSDGGAPGPWHWANVGHFRDMITSNKSSDKVGVQGMEGSLSLTWAGDYIAKQDWSHVYIVVGITDLDGDGSTDYDEIYVSAHTNNRKNHRLYYLEPDQTKVHFMWITAFKDP